MKLLNLLTAAVASAPALAFYPNVGLLQDNVSAPVNSTLGLLMPNPDMGWSDVLQTGKRAPWPRKNDGLCTITFCYSTKSMKENLSPIINKGIKVWMDALGGDAGSTTKHCLHIKEFQPSNPSINPYCHQLDNVGLWNPAVPEDALVVAENTGSTGSESSLGYDGNEDEGPGRHVMYIQPNLSIDQAYIVAHEFGHIFGMVHEMQRWDRDPYIDYRCHRFQGFYEKMAQCNARPDCSEQKLCFDWDFAMKMNFISAAYIRGRDGNVRDGEEGFDFDSLMLYGSAAAATEICKRTKLAETCPISKKQPGPDTLPRKFIEQNKKPSDRDLKFVRKWYPWKPLGDYMQKVDNQVCLDKNDFWCPYIHKQCYAHYHKNNELWMYDCQDETPAGP